MCGRRPTCASAARAPLPLLCCPPHLSASATRSQSPRRPVLSSVLLMRFVLGRDCHSRLSNMLADAHSQAQTRRCTCIPYSMAHTATPSHRRPPVPGSTSETHSFSARPPSLPVGDERTWQRGLFVFDFSSPSLWLAYHSPSLATSAPRHRRCTGQPYTSSLLRMQDLGRGEAVRRSRGWGVQP